MGARGLSARQLDELRELLECNRRELEATLAELSAKAEARAHSRSAQLGHRSRRQASNVSFQMNRLKRSLNHIRAALWRMRAGQYGACLSCDGPIGYTRLRYKPEAPLCQPCQFLGGEWRSAVARAP